MIVSRLRPVRVALALLAVILVIAAGCYFWLAPHTDEQIDLLSPQPVEQLLPGSLASMSSPLFTYTPGWQVDARGANPPEPVDPSAMPSGVITFDYTGGELALQIAVGDYWGYLFVTVDDQPANLLVNIPSNTDSSGQAAGYKPLYAPDVQTYDGPSVQWLPVHRAQNSDDVHRVRIEVWRSWAATPLRAVAVDALPPPPRPIWPGVGLLIAALWCALLFLLLSAHPPDQNVVYSTPSHSEKMSRMAAAMLPDWGQRVAPVIGLIAVACVTLAVLLEWWMLCLFGLALLVLAAVQRPAIALAVLLFGLPFYYTVSLPVLPDRSTNLIELGVLIGLGTALLHWLLLRLANRASFQGLPIAPIALLAVLASWALISATAAEYSAEALREWRTVFLASTLFAGALWLTLVTTQNRDADLWLLLIGWLTGALLFAVLSLALYRTDLVAFEAEGVRRLRGFYGSPNNLALYLDRVLPVTLALALFSARRSIRLILALITAPLLVAFLLTFSKGGLLIALPVMLATLWLGGLWLLHRQRRSTRVLWWLAVAAVVVGLLLAPVIGTQRFQRLFDFSQGTSFLRVNLWRSSLQMAFDHSVLGVGPDNFLYTYRSEYILPEAWQEPNLNHPHNWVLDWWTRLGLIGLVLGLTWWGWLIVCSTRCIASDTEDHSVLRLGLLAAVAAALAHGLIDASYALPDLMVLWALFSVLAVALRK